MCMCWFFFCSPHVAQDDNNIFEGQKLKKTTDTKVEMKRNFSYYIL
jgi:hypothetical protein